MDLLELYQKLNNEFPRMRFHRGMLFGKECVISSFGRKQFISIKISVNGEFKIDHSAMYKLGIHSSATNYEMLIGTIASLIKVSNPELLPNAQMKLSI